MLVLKRRGGGGRMRERERDEEREITKEENAICSDFVMWMIIYVIKPNLTCKLGITGQNQTSSYSNK